MSCVYTDLTLILDAYVACTVLLNIHKVKEGPNKGQIEPAIVRKIPLQEISKVSARLVGQFY